VKVLVVSEGKHEVGNEYVPGALVALVQRMTSSDAEFEALPSNDKRVRLHLRKGKTLNFERQALGWMNYAEQSGFDAVVYVIDRDQDRDRQAGLDKAQDNLALAIPRAMGLAIEAFDAWMLADEAALSQALGRVASRQKSPEGIRRPKDQCRQLRDESDDSPGLSEMYFRVAQTVDLDKLTDRCPKGFAPFRQRVEALEPDSDN